MLSHTLSLHKPFAIRTHLTNGFFCTLSCVFPAIGNNDVYVNHLLSENIVSDIVINLVVVPAYPTAPVTMQHFTETRTEIYLYLIIHFIQHLHTCIFIYIRLLAIQRAILGYGFAF
jgi:hypothetical protein